VTLPNVLSISRVPLGIAVGIFGANHNWGWAFALLLVGCATDVLDGLAAKFMNNEPVCDLALTVGAIAGLYFGDKLSLTTIIVVGAIAAVVQVINSFLSGTVLFTHFGQWFMPCFFLGILIPLVLGYADLALTSDQFTVFTVATVVVSAYLAWLKRERFRAWFTPGGLPA
jgi:phosphatidylglycerophosphate synthase